MQPTPRRVSTETDALVAYAREHEFKGPRAFIPSRHLAIVTCMDSRLDNFHIFGFDIGEVHVLRNAGGIVTDDMLRSLVLSQRLLQTREIIIVHHTDCGLWHADETVLRAELLAEFGDEPAYAFGTFRDVEADITLAVRRVRQHKYLPHRESVRGFVYDVETGHLREVAVA
jgi:carbonic anhydrase